MSVPVSPTPEPRPGRRLTVKTRTWWSCPNCSAYGSFTAPSPDDASWTFTLTERRHACLDRKAKP